MNLEMASGGSGVVMGQAVPAQYYTNTSAGGMMAHALQQQDQLQQEQQLHDQQQHDQQQHQQQHQYANDSDQKWTIGQSDNQSLQVSTCQV